MSDFLRDLKIGIGWDIDDKPLKESSEQTDQYKKKTEQSQKSVNKLGDRVTKAGKKS